MLDKEKIIVVYYMDISYVNHCSLKDYVESFSKRIGSFFDNSVKTIVVPINGDSRVECINPSLLSDNDYEKINKKIEDIENILKKHIQMKEIKSKLTKIGYGLDDVGIKQSYVCYTEHRSDINPFVTICGREMYPIVASPMESVIDENNYKVFIENKITPVIPRSIMSRCTIEDRLKLSEETFVSFSEKETYEIFEKGLFDLSDKTQYICIDMAHGTLNSLYEICKQIKKKYGEKVIIMTGNVNNEHAYSFYCDAGISYMRLCIGSGSRCTTACAVGVYTPAATLIDDIVQEKNKWINAHPEAKNYTKIIVDGGIDWYDKIQKSLALGADFVMIGKLFAECEEACGEIGYAESEEDFANGSYYTREQYEMYKKYTEEDFNLFGKNRKLLVPYRMYRGMSHRYSQKLIGGDGSKVSEGICKPVRVKYTLKHWITNEDSYLRSCMTYTNSRTIEELKENAEVTILGNNGKSAYAK